MLLRELDSWNLIYSWLCSTILCEPTLFIDNTLNHVYPALYWIIILWIIILFSRSTQLTFIWATISLVPLLWYDLHTRALNHKCCNNSHVPHVTHCALFVTLNQKAHSKIVWSGGWGEENALLITWYALGGRQFASLHFSSLHVRHSHSYSIFTLVIRCFVRYLSK